MRILVLNADYPRFLASLYLDRADLQHASYDAQLEARNDSLFGGADFYSANFNAHGQDAREIHLNNPWLQAAWAREHGLQVETPAPPRIADKGRPSFRKRLRRIARIALSPIVERMSRYELTPEEERTFLAQIEHFQPDLILNQEMSYVRDRVLRKVKKPGRLIVGQIASALPKTEAFSTYDFVISSLPNFVDWFRARGVRAELNRLAFEPRILEALGPAPARDVDVSFVGSLSVDHLDRVLLLERIAESVDLKLWGNGIESLPASSPLHRCYQGEAWGRGMYDVLRRSRISLNHHIDLAEGYANNMRLYEATGVGTMLMVDAQKNLADIFKPGVEVESYTSIDDCVGKIKALLDDEPRRAAIAAAGQARTLHEHTYYNRTAEILQLAANYSA